MNELIQELIAVINFWFPVNGYKFTVVDYIAYEVC
jgi:hypothetical protein